jgi:hypothetical protein
MRGAEAMLSFGNAMQVETPDIKLGGSEKLVCVSRMLVRYCIVLMLFVCAVERRCSILVRLRWSKPLK